MHPDAPRMACRPVDAKALDREALSMNERNE
jgi:hypothetical protein